MTLTNSIDPYNRLSLTLDEFNPARWSDISQILRQVRSINQFPKIKNENYLEQYAKGTAFITFDFGIDGVSIEISKYAKILEDIYESFPESSLHMIAGDFQPEAASILEKAWHRFQISGINGWDKWDDGKWFRALFKGEIISKSQGSKDLAQQIFKQGVTIAKKLGKFLIENDISLLIPVNIASNPGNMALTLGVVLVTELMGISVLNSNHDFYWESGKSTQERKAGEKIGPRDHFFRNSTHRNFFFLFQSLYPWNGERWFQVNINARQSRRLIKRTGIPKEKVQEISTSIADSFFKEFIDLDVKNARRRMARILSNGEPAYRSIGINQHLSHLGNWMVNQKPVLIGSSPDLLIDPESDNLIIFLQPTRIIARKRIERNLDFINALIRRSTFGKEFKRNSQKQLILHITGPVPIEHRKALEKILISYKRLVERLPEEISNRVFIAFSVGQEEHPTFVEQDFSPLTIESIYRMANLVLFPSETEGRGLPIIEAGAIGIPIICSRYHPKEVFQNVIGTGLPDEQQISYTLFPEGKFSKRFLREVSTILMSSRGKIQSIAHNRAAVKARYSHQALKEKFELMLKEISRL